MDAADPKSASRPGKIPRTALDTIITDSHISATWATEVAGRGERTVNTVVGSSSTVSWRPCSPAQPFCPSLVRCHRLNGRPEKGGTLSRCPTTLVLQAANIHQSSTESFDHVNLSARATRPSKGTPLPDPLYHYQPPPPHLTDTMQPFLILERTPVSPLSPSIPPSTTTCSTSSTTSPSPPSLIILAQSCAVPPPITTYVAYSLFLSLSAPASSAVLLVSSPSDPPGLVSVSHRP